MSQSLRVLMLPDYRADNPYQSLLTEALAGEGVSVEFPKGYRRIFPILRASLDNNLSFQVVHLHWITPYVKGKSRFTKTIYGIKFLFDLAFVRLFGIHIIWTVHNQVSHDTPFPGLEYWLRRQISRLAHQVIVHHNSAKPLITQAYRLQPAKLISIPIGHYRSVYPAPVSQDKARQILSSFRAKRLYLYQGMIRPYKGLETLIKVWTEIPDFSKENQLIIAGKSLDPLYGQSIAKLTQDLTHDENTIVLNLRFLEDHELSLLFSAADCVVLPFTQVLTSSSVVVAMSFGKPVIAPRLGGIPETLAGADDLLYDPEDPQGLGKALQESTEIDLEDLSDRTAKACDLLDWKDIAMRTKLVYSA